MSRPIPALLLALLVVLSGCSFVTSDTATPAAGPSTPTALEETQAPTDEPADSTPTDTTADSTPTSGIGDDARPDPEEDVLGWEQGYWHNESLDVDASDGLNDSEFEKVKARAMARVEVVRGLEFREDVRFEFTTREQLSFPARGSQFQDAYWEAAFVVGEDRTARAAYQELYDVIVDGIAYGGDRIEMIVEDPESPKLDTAVLAHELIHAVESQNDVYEFPSELPTTGDLLQGYASAVEGSAMFYERKYTDRCGEQWSCVEGREAAPPAGIEAVNAALYVDFSVRYTLGQQYVAAMAERDALGAMRSNPPTSTEQVIHPERYPEDQPEAVPIEDRTAEGWERVERDDRPNWDTFGEARLYTMLWHNGVIEGGGPVEVTTGQQVPLNYTHPATNGWAGDRVVVYTDGTYEGYVFRSKWESERDARQFHEAYLELLRSHDAREVREGVYVIDEGPFEDAFRVTREGDTVTVVNAPRVELLDDVHAPD